MTNEFATRLKAVDQTILNPHVRNALENNTAEVADWSYQPVSGGMTQEVGGSYGLYRFKGTAQIQDKIVLWSLILKAMGPSEVGTNTASYWAYRKREMLAYQSGLLDDLPGDLFAPRCFGVIEYPGDEFWIWLEDIPEQTESIWPLERYGLAARHLGQFNGAYLVDRPLPDEPWLSQGRVRDWLEWGEPTIRDLHNLNQHPLAQRWFRDNSIERLLNLWTERDMLLEVMDRLPRSLCHHDAFRRNLMARTNKDGHEQTVAIDWSIVGTGAIGEEIAPLIAISLQFLEVNGSEAKELDAFVFEGYLLGLHDAGWRGDPRLVRFGYVASVALFMGVAGASLWLNFILADEGKVAEKILGYPINEVLDQFTLLQNYLFDLGDEARTLINAIQ